MTDEDKLIELLQQYRTGDAQAGDAIFEMVDKYFRRELLPILTKVFGAEVRGKPLDNERRADHSLRYTEWMQNFFVKVLDKRPDAFWKAQTARDLRVWSSVVIANMMRDHLRRRKRGQAVLAEIAPLVVEKQTYFEDRYETRFEDFLELLTQQEASDDEELKLMSAALRLRYVDGVTWKQIAQDLAISDERLTKIRQQAERELKKKLVR